MSKNALALVVFAATCFAQIAMAQSQPPPPTPSEPAQEKQNVGHDEHGNAKPNDTPAQVIQPVIDKSKSKPTEKDRNTGSDKDGDESALKWWNFYNAIAVTLFTLVLAVVAVLQWSSMRQQANYMKDGLEMTKESNVAALKAANAAEESVKHAKETARIDQRAWITIKGAILQQPLKVNEAPVIRTVITNSGRTPALEVGVFSGVFLQETGQEISASLNHIERTVSAAATDGSRGVVTPNFDFQSIRDDAVPINAAQIEGIVAGSITLYIAGFVEYTDVFKEIHRTRFAFRISGQGQLDKRDMVICNTGNTVE